MPYKEEPILSRFNRLDYMMGCLEELKTGGHKSVSARSSSPPSPSSGTGTTGTTLTSDDGGMSVNSSPKSSLERRCRPVDEVLMEIRLKGTLIDRLRLLEDRVLKMGLMMEQEIESERKREEAHEHHQETKSPRKKGLKGYVKSCVPGHHNKHHMMTSSD